ncbi:allatostatin A-like isoform X2 [Solenopsis invicta]|uniref:allatostatin A-like isoform X2 n=1 Tax=Solenopsis invicta TaxID=13686 RepID=UPI00193D63DB|nr:allatostatin A-like isoform X2 [Solenopsis invicta]
MKSRMSLITIIIIIFYVLNVVGRSSAAIQEKKSYIEEYKRLPLYNFGIGKRMDNNEDKRNQQFSFGIGKRLRDFRFGLGKRNAYHPFSLDFLADNIEGYQSRDNSNDFMGNKRSQYFGFGLGKRTWKLPPEEMTGKRLNDSVVLKFLLGLGKEPDEDNDLIQ